MIYGVGTDLCAVDRMEKSIAKPSFLSRVYTPQEQALLSVRSGRAKAETAAANFAAKEAFLKACGMGLAGFALCEIAALRREGGAPYLVFDGAAARFMKSRRLTAHLSLTHEAGLAAALVVLEQTAPLSGEAPGTKSDD